MVAAEVAPPSGSYSGSPVHKTAKLRALAVEGEALRAENRALKRAVEEAKRVAAQRVLQAQTENQELQSNNAELRALTAAARELVQRKVALAAQMELAEEPPPEGSPEWQEWSELEAQAVAIRNQAENVVSHPVRAEPGDTMDSPRSDTMPSVSPRFHQAEGLMLPLSRQLSPKALEKFSPWA
mmetsp:Transcript_68873/g.147466  ORF Transcript_68873/g.147466 Transcript_68873/m.147466 type:complete len:183 (-) Transcript_68873:44-592(-)